MCKPFERPVRVKRLNVREKKLTPSCSTTLNGWLFRAIQTAMACRVAVARTSGPSSVADVRVAWCRPFLLLAGLLAHFPGWVFRPVPEPASFATFKCFHVLQWLKRVQTFRHVKNVQCSNGSNVYSPADPTPPKHGLILIVLLHLLPRSRLWAVVLPIIKAGGTVIVPPLTPQLEMLFMLLERIRYVGERGNLYGRGGG